MMNVICYQSDSELARLRDGWKALAGGEPFLSWEWLTSWWRHFGPAIRQGGGSLLVLAVESPGSGLVGLAPWYVANSVRGRVIRFLGSGAACTDYLTLLAAPEHECAVLESLAAWLAAAGGSTSRQPPSIRGNGMPRPPRPRKVWDLIELDGVDASDGRVAALMGGLARRGVRVESERPARCWRVAFPPTWEAFLAKLSKSHRKQVGRCQRRYLDTGRAVLHIARTEEELKRGLAILQELHGRRRQMLGDAGRFADACFAGFVAEASRLLLPRGQTRLCWLEIDGRLAAAELHLAGPRTVYAYQSGVNPHLLEHEPGRIITLATLRGALADGFAEFDFLRGDEPYKAHWRAEPRPQVVWRAVAPRMLPQARFAAWQAARKLRRSLKKLTENLRSRTAVSTSQAAASELPAPSAPVSPDGPVASDDTEALAALSDSTAGARADQHGHASGRAQPQEVAR